MINEYWNSLTSQVRLRTTNPLLGGYVLSWLFVNYKVPILIFSGLDVQTKLSLCDAILRPTLWSGYWECYGIPLLISLSFLVLYPLISRPVYWWWQLQQNILVGVRKRIEDKRPLTREEEREIRKSIWKLTTEYAAELKSRDETISLLKLQLSQDETAREAVETETKGAADNQANFDSFGDETDKTNAFDSLTYDQQSLLESLYKNNGYLTLENHFPNGPSVDFRHAAEVLEKYGFLQMSQFRWSLTPLGNALTVYASRTHFGIS